MNDYDKEDYICSNTANRRNRKIFQNMIPEDQLSRNNMLNTRSTLIDEGRPVTVVDIIPGTRTTGERIGTKQGYNY